MASLKRVFSIGYEFNDGRVQNAEFHEPDSSLGHDLIYWDPSSLPDGYNTGESGAACFIEGASARAFAKDRERRAAEFQEHLGAGKAIVVAVPPSRTLIVTRVVEGETLEFEWSLADPLSLLSRQPELTAARGNAFELISDRSFAKFWEWTEEISTYECYFNDPPGTPLLRISGTNKVVATAVPVSSGVILYLPRLDPQFEYDDDPPKSLMGESTGESRAHKDFLDLLWAACQQFLRDGSGRDPSLPKWTDAILIPGEEEAINAKARAQDRLKTAQTAIQEQDERIAALRERKILISGTGPSLERVVDEAFCALGFDVEPGEPGRTDRIVRRKRRIAVVEIKGKSKSASERDAAQLEKWRSDFHAAHGTMPKGILVVNAWKGKTLADRKKLVAFPNQMLPFAVEQRQQCLITGIQLLGLWLEAEKHPNRIDKFARSIMACSGLYPGYGDWKEVVALADSDP